MLEIHCCYVCINIGGGIEKQQQFKGKSMAKCTQKILLATKYWGLYIKGLASRWFYEGNNFFGYIIF